MQGKCIAAGVMLACMCDLIVASDDASFQNPVLRMTGAAVEILVEPWEMPARKAKEFLLAAETFTAAEAERLGMVNRVVPAAELTSAARDARRSHRPRAADHRPGREAVDQQDRRSPGAA